MKCNFVRVSSRTLVTQDDPLGALNDDLVDDKAAQSGQDQSQEVTSSTNADKRHIFTDQPILFRGHRSQTFDESMTNMNKSMHRSETMPGNSVTSSLASSIKFFG